VAISWFRLLALTALSLCQAARADSGEHQLKAAFLYNFAKFVEWPEANFSQQQKINLCVVGHDQFGPALDTIERKMAQGREVLVRRDTLPDAVRDCQIVFVSASETKNLARVLQAVTGANALTVSDMEGFCEAGGMIALVVADKRVAFEVNLDAAHRADLKLSAQLLKLARTIYGVKTKR
jgi:YfiR/HmsC-like